MAKKISGKEYDTWSKEELIKEIVKIKSTTYGLVWHRDVPEEKIDILVNPDARTPNEMFPNEMAGKPFPVLKEVAGKAIKSDDTKNVNLIIEGDNYHSLAVLNFTHQEAVDLIYIDPPYNTGNKDFIYNDKFVDKEDSFRHSKWLSFMEKRLKLARNLLCSDGIMFISIDENEHAPLRMLCDEIFGESNHIIDFVWKKRKGGGNDSFFASLDHEYVICYAKNIHSIKRPWMISYDNEYLARYKYEDDYGRYYWDTLSRKGLQNPIIFDIQCPDGSSLNLHAQISEKTFKEKFELGEVRIVQTKNGWSAQHKIYLPEGKSPRSILDSVATNSDGKSDLRDLFKDEDIFTNPKPKSLIKYFVQLSKKNAVVLDFMAGSGTTGHAVLDLNKEDGGNRNFILCTNNENNIAIDVCYPRLSKVIKGYKNSKGDKISALGGNLKYYKTDFVEAEPTDKNKRKLVKESADMLCILENAFELIQETKEYKIYKNTDKYVGVIFYDEAIDDYKKAIAKIDGHFNTYVFSMNDDPHTKKFTDIKSKVTLCAIPDVILKVYREIFK